MLQGKSESKNSACAWGSDQACCNYKEVASRCDFHKYCNYYSTLQLIGNVRNLSILDLPSGPGIFARALLRKGAAHVTSVDVDPKVIAHCQQYVPGLFDCSAGNISAPSECDSSKWCGITVDGATPRLYPGALFDVVRANFLLENFPLKEDMYSCARNVYDNLKPGGRYVGLWAPGAHSADRKRVVRELVGMDTSDISGMSSGDVCRISYADIGNDKVFEWYLRSEDELAECLSSVGFVNISFQRLAVDPAYKGSQDLKKFVEVVGNRHILATKPF